MLKDGDNLADVVGHPLNFHDAEVLTFTLDRQGPTVTIEVLLNADLGASEYRDRQVEGESTYIFTLRFYDVEDIEITGFNHQNVIQDLVVSADGDRWKIHAASLFGADFSLTCAKAEVANVTPTALRTGDPFRTR